MNKPKKVILVILPTLDGGGAERVAVDLMNEWSNQNLDIHLLLVLRSNHILLDQLDSQIIVHKINSNRLLSSTLEIRRLVCKLNPDIVWAGLWPLTCISSLALFGIPKKPRLVLTEHIDHSGYLANETLAYKISLILSVNLTYPIAHSIVAVSKGASASLSMYAPILKKKIKFLPNATRFPDIEIVKSERKRRTQERHEGSIKTFISIGTLKRQKNFHLLLDAFKIVRSRINARLELLGDGPLKAELITYSETLGIGDDVIFRGFQENISQYIYNSDVFVLSSDWEGLGMVLVEALLHGRPVISTDCKSGPREILYSGRLGKLVPVNDKNALAEAMIEVEDNFESIDFIHNSLAKFDIKNSSREYINLFFSAQ